MRLNRAFEHSRHSATSEASREPGIHKPRCQISNAVTMYSGLPASLASGMTVGSYAAFVIAPPAVLSTVTGPSNQVISGSTP